MHAALYAGLMLLAAFSLRTYVPSWKFIVLLVLVALMHEGLQVLTARRGFTGAEIFDLVIDFCGGLVGFAVTGGLRRWAKGRP